MVTAHKFFYEMHLTRTKRHESPNFWTGEAFFWNHLRMQNMMINCVSDRLLSEITPPWTVSSVWKI